MKKQFVVSMLIACLVAPAALLAQALPGYERTAADQIRNNTSRRQVKLADYEMEKIQEMDLKAWKNKAICWGHINYEGEEVKVEFGDAACFRMKQVQLKRAKADIVPGESIVLPKPKKVKNISFTLPDGNKVDHRAKGEGAELFGVFMLNSTSTWTVLGRDSAT